ncbi:MAG: CpsD/CapB family tyrosine-protein kinase [Acidimicrobiales bacterium]
MSRRGTRAVVAAEAPDYVVESAATLKASVELSLAELDRSSILVTSAMSGEGRTTVAADLARLLALSGHRVVLVDFDLRRPGVHERASLPKGPGVVDVLLGRHPADACLRFVALESGQNGASRGLYVLAAGELEGEPSQLLGGKRTRALLRALESQASVVLVDGPSVLGHPDAVLVGRLVGGALMVVESGGTPTTRVEQAKAELMAHQVRILGVVLNKTRPSQRD